MEIYQSDQKEEIINVSKHLTSIIDLPCRIGKGTTIWHWSHIREQTKIGENCVIGQGVYIDKNVVIGNNCHIQNNVNLYEGVILEDDVYIGPGVTFINVRKPSMRNKRQPFETTVIKSGASIGANATILCGVTIGEDAIIGCGSVVNKNVPPYCMVVGNPGRVIKTFHSV
jgi:UDP-2-acetamido-3-amino-2,3-dideoxy-glucuronate N-acetyltransferase